MCQVLQKCAYPELRKQNQKARKMSDIPEVQEYTNLCFAGSQQQTNSLLDDPNLASAIKKMVEVQVAVMMFPAVKRIVESFLGSLEPMMENLVRKTVKQEIELAQERFFTREKWKPHDDPHTSQVRCLELQFLDRISVPVYTGKHIKGERGDSIKLALVDSDGNLVTSVPEASATVEILVVQEGACHGDNSYNCGDSEGMISEKKGRKPLLSRNHFKMKEGIVNLENVKFKNKSKWTKSCEVNLVARVVENLNGTKVKDAKTESFRVMDCRSTLYTKHDPPMLSDEVWRLQKISKGGRIHKRLLEAKIYSVQEFLISLNLDARSLQQRLNVGAEKFKVIVDHARRCEIGGKLYMYCTSGRERKFSVVFDVVGHLRGLVREQLFVPVDDLSEDEKVEAHKMVVSAIEHWEDVQSIDNEASADIPSQLSDGVNSISSRIESPSGSNYGICNTISGNGRALSRTSSRHMSPIYSIGGTSCFDGFAGLFQMDNMDSLSHVQLIANEASLVDIPSQLSDGVNTSISSQIESPSSSNFGFCNTISGNGRALSRTSSRHMSPIYSIGGTSCFDGFEGLFQMDSTDSLSHVQSIDNEASLADIPSQLSDGANTSISSRIESPSGSNFGICNTISGNGRALSRTSSRHMSPIYSIGGTSCFDGSAGLFQMDNIDFLIHRMNYPDLSRSTCADSDNEYQQFLIWNHDDYLEFGNPNVESRADQSNAATGCHRNDAQVLSPSRAQLRWRMAVVSVRKRNMAPEDTHSQKKQRHS